VVAVLLISKDSWWDFQLDSVNVGTAYKHNTKVNVVSDTGTSLLIGQTKTVKGIAKAVGAKWNSDYEVYTIKCDATYTPVTFVINGVKYNLTSAALTMDMGIGDNKCLFAPYPMDLEDYGLDWILGDPFIRQYCQIYDIGQSRLGFANPLNWVGQANTGNSTANASAAAAKQESFGAAMLKRDVEKVLSKVPKLEQLLRPFH